MVTAMNASDLNKALGHPKVASSSFAIITKDIDALILGLLN
jgi:hypothetical protein